MTPTPFPADVTALADRASIENLMTDYYANIGRQDFDFSVYFAPDGALDVNGLVAKGAKEIKALYERAGGGAGHLPEASRDPNAPPPGGPHMQLTNLKVEVHGETGTAELFWSTFMSETLVSPPRVTEYGRERTELVKLQGRWLIKRRVVTSYGGMPEGLMEPYRKSRMGR